MWQRMVRLINKELIGFSHRFMSMAADDATAIAQIEAGSALAKSE